MFGNIQTKSGSQSIHSGSKLSCTRCREVLLKKIADVGILSLSLGTASEVAVHLPPLMVVSLIDCLSALVDSVRKTLGWLLCRLVRESLCLLDCTCFPFCFLSRSIVRAAHPFPSLSRAELNVVAVTGNVNTFLLV